MKFAKYAGLVILLAGGFSSQAQDEAPKLTLKGYVKDLFTANFSTPNDASFDNLIHNRLNLKWYPNEHLTGALEVRNRFFIGNSLGLIPNYGSYVDVNNDYVDLSVLPINNDKAVLHMMIDRAYLQWNKNNLEVTVGRQRINWGQNLVWNPNDIFNAYSFFDFDYEERPGSDALRVQYYTGVASSVEATVKAADSWDKVVAAGIWQTNKWNYDFQGFAGKMNEHAVLGGGWAGSIKNAGFKGEMTWFSEAAGRKAQFITSSSVDYSFANSFYVNGSFLFNSSGTSKPDQSALGAFSLNKLDVRSLSPYRWSVFGQASYPFHPLVSGGLSLMVFPSDMGCFTSPFVTYSVVPNLDLDLLGQFFLGDIGEGYTLLAKVAYTRVKWSF
ncbi:MAG: hypothetical protein RIF36_09870 [Imperialibacter sp.]|uniref:hypothetical protein n=1 Tax=Imperialibacter sp. TaxID=2038411 RepID=UPI0032EF949A